jgi:ParB family chromosome partitioning protein
MPPSLSEKTELIAVDAITVVNPRVRNQKVFDEIVANIAELGLKRPITVAARNDETSGDLTYELVCGQGRLEAFKVLKQQEIPAVVITASSEDCLVMSLVENLARRQHHSLDLLRDIKRLQDSGYFEREFAPALRLKTLWTKNEIHDGNSMKSEWQSLGSKWQDFGYVLKNQAIQAH